jgi:hypothetical protein
MHTWTPDSGKKKNIKQGFPYEEQVQLDGVLLTLRHFPPLVTGREIGALKKLAQPGDRFSRSDQVQQGIPENHRSYIGCHPVHVHGDRPDHCTPGRPSFFLP